MGILKSLFGGKDKAVGKPLAAGSGSTALVGAPAPGEVHGVEVLYQEKELQQRILKEQPEELLAAFQAPSVAEASTDPERAAAWLLARLRADAKLREQFPRALSDGAEGDFARWLATSEAPKRFALTTAEAGDWPGLRAGLQEALANPPGEAVTQLWLLKKNWQAKHPRLLCEDDIKDVLRWLLRRGPTEFGLSQTAVLWFFQEWGEKPEEAAALTYRVRAEWQKQFPVLLESESQRKIFVRWARENLSLTLDPEKLNVALDKTPLEYDPDVPEILEPRLRQILKPTGESLLPVVNKKVRRLGINLLAHFCYPSGLQQAAMGFLRGARQAGLAVSARDVPVEAERRASPRTLQVLGMEHYDVTIMMIYPNAMFPRTYELAGLHPRVGVRRIGYWFWESENVPDEVVQMAEDLHEIWVATEYIATAMRARIPGKPVHVVLPNVDPPRPAPLNRTELGLGIDEQACMFGFVFDMSSTLTRKNALGLLGAFSRAFGDDDPSVALVIKTQRGELHPEEFQVLAESCATYSNVLLINESWPLERVFALLNSMDCYISLHRAEGLGLTMAEAMLLGKPVIASGYSGNLDFMNAGNSLLVPARKTVLMDPAPPYPAGTTWAEPDLEAAAAHMRWVRANPGQANELGAKARRELRVQLSVEATGERIRERVMASFLASHESTDQTIVPMTAMNAITARKIMN